MTLDAFFVFWCFSTNWWGCHLGKFRIQFRWLWRAWMARVFKNFCPSAQDKSVLLRLHKKGVPTQLSTWQLAPFWHRQDKPLDQSRKKQNHLHPDVRMCWNWCFNSMKSFTWPVVDPHTFFYQSQKWGQQEQDHLKWKLYIQWQICSGYWRLNVPSGRSQRSGEKDFGSGKVTGS